MVFKKQAEASLAEGSGLSTLLWRRVNEGWERACVPATCESGPHTEHLTTVSSDNGRSVRTAGTPRASEEQLSHAYHLLMAQLSQEHAEIRLSAFQIVDELFARSHQFRMLVVSDFQEFLELTLGTDHKQPLPPPREVAQRLRQAATQAIQGWNEKFGAAYKKLALGHHFLRHNQQVRWPWWCCLGGRLRLAPWLLGQGCGLPAGGGLGAPEVGGQLCEEEHKLVPRCGWG